MDKKIENKRLLIGCHLSSVKGFAAMGKNACDIDANTFAFYEKSQRGKAKEIDEADVEKLKEILKRKAFWKIGSSCAIYAEPVFRYGKNEELCPYGYGRRYEENGISSGQLLQFPSRQPCGTRDREGIELISDLLNQIITPEQSTVILLETMSGKGSEVGSRFEELAEIISRVNHDEKMGVCLDTCHVSDAGYDIINDLDGVLEEFDRVVGLDRLKALHINDSMNERGAHKDRHACIGDGHLGLKTILHVINHPKLAGIPCILETPQEDLEGYTREIKMLRKESETYGN